MVQLPGSACRPGITRPSSLRCPAGRAGMAITPAGPRCVLGGHHEPGSPIWRSRWITRSVTEGREALAMPADLHRCVLLRRVEALHGRAKLQVVLDVRAAFGRQPMRELGRVLAVRVLDGTGGPVLAAVKSRPRTGWSAAGQLAARRACMPRRSTCISGRRAATCRRHSRTQGCCNGRPAAGQRDKLAPQLLRGSVCSGWPSREEDGRHGR
jgi:hypothetical protein